MKKQLIGMSAAAVLFMLALPVLFVTLKHVVPFTAFLLLIYLFCPLCSIVLGVLAEKNVSRLWCFSVLPALLALVTYSFLLNFSTSLTFAGCYLSLGLIAMGISTLARVYLQNRKKK